MSNNFAEKLICARCEVQRLEDELVEELDLKEPSDFDVDTYTMGLYLYDLDPDYRPSLDFIEKVLVLGFETIYFQYSNNLEYVYPDKKWNVINSNTEIEEPTIPWTPEQVLVRKRNAYVR